MQLSTLAHHGQQPLSCVLQLQAAGVVLELQQMEREREHGLPLISNIAADPRTAEHQLRAARVAPGLQAG